MDILTLEEIKTQLEGKQLLIVAGESGLSYPTVHKLSVGEVTNYAYETIRKISAYLKD
mgnify:CR=1 FL=1